VAGFFALLWLLLRTGTKPSRFAYPCQQVATSAATLALGAPLVSTLVSVRSRLAAGLRTPSGIAVVALGLMISAATRRPGHKGDDGGVCVERGQRKEH